MNANRILKTLVVGVFNLGLIVAVSGITPFTNEVYAAQVHAGHTSTSAQQGVDWKLVEQAIGKTGTLLPGGVFKISLPRTDLQVSVGDVHIKPAFALGSHIEFLPMVMQTMLMGDLVLTVDELNPVMLKLQQGGIEQSAIHNHLIGEMPRVLYLHVMGQGDPVKLARAIHDALILSKTPLSTPIVTSTPVPIGLNTQQLERILGYKGMANGGVYQFSIPRAEKVLDNGMEIPPAMGIANAINFQPTGGNKAAITGDFVLLASEVNPVIRALREKHIEVTALHSHMLTEQPHLFFMHFWANDDALKLAQGLRIALNTINIAKP